MTVKYEAIQKSDSPKIIIVGGSNVAYGFDSEELAKRFNVPVVNFGLHAGFGLKFILSDLEQYIHEGDLVILMPEYEQFTNDRFNGTDVLTNYIFNYHPEKINLLSYDQLLFLREQILGVYQKRLKDEISDVVNPGTRTHQVSEAEGLYNGFGDVIYHWNDVNKVVPEPSVVVLHLNDQVFTSIMEFKSYFTGENASLVLYPPALHEQYYDAIENEIDEIDRKLTEDGIPFLASPRTFRYTPSLFYNSHYHLNKKGIDKRVGYMLSDENLAREIQSWKNSKKMKLTNK